MQLPVETIVNAGVSDVSSTRQVQGTNKGTAKDVETSFVELLAQLLSGGNAQQAIINGATQLNLAPNKSLNSEVREEKVIEKEEKVEVSSREKKTTEENNTSIETQANVDDPSQEQNVSSENDGMQSDKAVNNEPLKRQSTQDRSNHANVQENSVVTPQVVKKQQDLAASRFVQGQENLTSTVNNSQGKVVETQPQVSSVNKLLRNITDFKVQDKTEDLSWLKPDLLPQQAINQQAVANVKKAISDNVSPIVRNFVGPQILVSGNLEHNNFMRMPNIGGEGFSKVDFGGMISGVTKEKQASGGNLASTSKLSSGLQAQIIERIQQLLDQSAKNSNGNSMVVRLDPPSLGMMTVKVVHRGDQLFAKIMADSPDVESMLRFQIPEIVKALSVSGIKADNVTVSIGKELTQNFFNNSFGQGLMGQNDFGQQMSFGKHQGKATNLQLTNLPEGNLRNIVEQGWVA